MSEDTKTEETKPGTPATEATTSAPTETPAPEPANADTSVDWNAKADNCGDDVYVQVTEPLFNNQVVTATVQAPELVAADQNGNGEAVKLAFKIDEEIEDTMGQKKAPGFIWRPPFSSIIRAATNDQKDKEERGLRDLARLGEAVGALPKAGRHLTKDIIRAVGSLEGKKVTIKFNVTKGNKLDDEGNPRQFQNARFAAPGSVSAAPSGGADY